MDRIGVIHGRFQMLHHGHMEYLLEGKKRCEYLLVGITNPDAGKTAYRDANPHRSQAAENPLTYYERFQMIKGALLEAGVPREGFDIIPFPINVPEQILQYAPREATYYMTLYDAWSAEKKRVLEDLGCRVSVMWERTNEEKFTSGSEVRSLIAAGKEWKSLVPDFVYRYVLEHGIDERIRRQREALNGN